MSRVAFVAIGKNEGERLKRCLASLLKESDQIVYVDSGSTDGSVEFAKSLGVTVAPLDTTRRFNMSRARNAGFEAVRSRWPEASFVHFVDGDCELVEGWVSVAEAFFHDHPEVVAVCGRRRERFPERSVFNRLCDIEWNTPIGETKACGGDALFRVEAFRRLGGFDEKLIAGEEPELCMRLRHAGGKIWRLDREMTRHDANITKVSQWWKRHVRAGYAAADVSRRTGVSTGGREVLFADKLRSPLIWVVGTIAILGGTLFSLNLSVILIGLSAVVFIYVLQACRIAAGIRKRTECWPHAFEYGFSSMLAKWAQVRGILQSWSDQRHSRQAEVIDYKGGQ